MLRLICATVDDERSGSVGGKRREAFRHRTLYRRSQEPVRLCRRDYQSQRNRYYTTAFCRLRRKHRRQIHSTSTGQHTNANAHTRLKLYAGA